MISVCGRGEGREGGDHQPQQASNSVGAGEKAREGRKEERVVVISLIKLLRRGNDEQLASIGENG